MKPRLASLWRNLVHRGRADRDLDDELGSMFELLVDENLQRGMDLSEARRQAMLALGGVESVKSQVRDARAGASFETFIQDVRYGFRSLRRTPGITFAAILTLALGIGATTTIFTLLDAVLLKPLHVHNPEELVTLYENAPGATPDAAGGTGRYLRFSYPRFERLQQAMGTAGSVAAVTRTGRFFVRLPGRAQTSAVRVQLVSGSYFPTLGIAAARGRLLTADDAAVDNPRTVAVISDGFWKRVLGGNDAAVGSTLIVNGVEFTIAGVTPPAFVGIWTDIEPDLWLPVTLQVLLGYQTNSSSYGNADRNQPWVRQANIAWLNLFARVAPGEVEHVTPRLHEANAAGVAELAATFDDPEEHRAMLKQTLAVEPFARGFSGLRSQFATALVALAALVIVVLLVTCANIANLLLARGAAQWRDVAIRLSLGATTSRLIRQYLTESTLLAAAGGIAGLATAQWASAFLARQVLNTSGQLPPAFAPDARVLLFASGVSLATAVLFGLAPALRAARGTRAASIATGERQAIGQSAMRGMRPLVAAQLALSVVVIVAAALMGRTLINFARMDPGFAADELLSASFDAAASGYTLEQMPALSEQLVAAVAPIPGLRSASVSMCGLVNNCSYSSTFTFEGGQRGARILQNWIGRQYFATAGIPIVAGRAFDTRDRATSQRVAMITESIARRYFPGQNPLGKRLGFKELDTEIVGVVRDAHAMRLRDDPAPMIYFPLDQPPAFRAFAMNLDVRVTGASERAVPQVREALRANVPQLLVDSVTAMPTRLARDIGRERIVAYLSFGFAALAMLLASIGLYGVLSYAVAQRTKEIGVRIALGARRTQVATLVLADALKIVAAGLVAGLIAAVAAGRLLNTLLFAISASDPATYAISIALLFAVAILAAYLPARRAARVSPMTALRME